MVDVEIIKGKKARTFQDVMESPFEAMEYAKQQDKLVIEYREKELALLREILKELKTLNKTKGEKVS